MTLTRLLCLSFLFSVVFNAQAADEKNHKGHVAFSYFLEDVCWTTEAKGCEVHGVQAKFIKPMGGWFVLTSFGYFESRQGKAVTGNSRMESTTFSIGTGKTFDSLSELFPDNKLSAEISLKLQSDDEFENKNHNLGYEFRLQYSKLFNSGLWQAGAELAYQRYQDCSNPDCHLLRDRKPLINNLQGVMSINRRVNKNYSIGYRISHIKILSSRERYIDRTPRQPGHELLVTYHF